MVQYSVCFKAVSYTHLDVYKRQAVVQPVGAIAMSCGHLRARHALPVVGGGIATVIDLSLIHIL